MPNEGVGFFMVHHLEGHHLRFDLKRLILDSYFPGSPPNAPEPHAAAGRQLRRFTGKYRATPYCHSCEAGGPFVQDFEVTANQDGTMSLWDERWVEVSPLYFVSADGRKHFAFTKDPSGRIIGLTGGSWRVLERLE
jgi:hypothetical protein